MRLWFGTPKQLHYLPDPGPSIGLPRLSFPKLPVVLLTLDMILVVEVHYKLPEASERCQNTA